MTHCCLQTVDTLETPVFVVDDEKLIRNLKMMKEKAAQLGVTLRPHFKTHKSLEIAREQMVSSTGPVTVSTLKEAEALVAQGVTDIIYGVGICAQKLNRVKALNDKGADVKILVDSVAGAEIVSAFCLDNRCRLRVLIEIDCDGHRSGLRPASDVIVKVARALSGGAQLAGVLTHAGGSYDCTSVEAIEAAAVRERDGIVQAADQLRAAGFNPEIVSLGSTPSVRFSKNCSGVTEVRCGVYALFDLFMMNLGVCTLDEIAGSVLTTVIGHQPEKGWVICDAGWMAMSRDRGTARQKHDWGYGMVCDRLGRAMPEFLMTGANQEHGIIARADGALIDPADFPLGTRLRILPNHVCATVAAYDEIVCLNDAGVVTRTVARIHGWR